MKKLLFILPILFLIAGCSSQNTKMSDDELFEKKQECASYKDKIEKEIEKRNIEYTYDGQESYEKLASIFYSPKNNTCMYHTQGYFIYVIDGKQESRDVKEVYDYLSNEKIIQTPNFCYDREGRNVWYREGICLEDDFSQKLQELKVE